MSKKKGSLKLAIDLPDTTRFSTGFISLDNITGGGLVVGSIVEIFGNESVGKTTLGLQLLAKAQKDGYETLLIDAEHVTTKEYAARFLDNERLYYERPASGEEAYDKLRLFWRDFGDVKNMVLIDSVPALIPETQVETGESNFGPVASLMAKNLPSILRGYSNSIVIFINQMRANTSQWGSETKTTGGKALPFYAGHRFSLTKAMIARDSDKQATGTVVKVYCEKNKFGAPFKVCQLELGFGDGYSMIADIVNNAVDRGIIEKSGAWYSYNGERIGQGKKTVVGFLEDNENIQGEIYGKLVKRSL